MMYTEAGSASSCAASSSHKEIEVQTYEPSIISPSLVTQTPHLSYPAQLHQIWKGQC